MTAEHHSVPSILWSILLSPNGVRIGLISIWSDALEVLILQTFGKNSWLLIYVLCTKHFARFAGIGFSDNPVQMSLLILFLNYPANKWNLSQMVCMHPFTYGCSFCRTFAGANLGLSSFWTPRALCFSSTVANRYKQMLWPITSSRQQEGRNTSFGKNKMQLYKKNCQSTRRQQCQQLGGKVCTISYGCEGVVVVVQTPNRLPALQSKEKGEIEKKGRCLEQCLSPWIEPNDRFEPTSLWQTETGRS